jgi:hypothetical protein
MAVVFVVRMIYEDSDNAMLQALLCTICDVEGISLCKHCAGRLRNRVENQ